MIFLKRYRLGLIIGFLFGTVGMWIMAALSLMSHVAELLSVPFFALSRGIAGIIVTGDSAGTGTVILLYLITGVIYAAIGVLIQWIIGKIRTKGTAV